MTAGMETSRPEAGCSQPTKEGASAELWRLLSPTFIVLWVGLFVSLIGDGMYSIGLMTLVKQRTGSSAQMAIVQVCIAVPQLIIGLFAGVMADRLDRRKLMIMADIGRGLIVAVPGVLILLNQLHIWQVYLAAGLLSSVGAFFFPCMYASLPNIVPQSQLTRANSIFQFTFALCSILGYAVGGVIVQFYGAATAMLVDSLSFILCAAAVISIRFTSRATEKRDNGVMGDLKEGMRYLLSVPVLTGLIILFAVLNFCLAPTAITIPTMVYDVLKRKAAGYGLITAGMSGGLLLGSIVLGIGIIRRKGLAIVGTIILMGAGLVAFGLSRNFWLSALVMFGIGVLLACVNILIQVIFQSRVPDQLRGRALSALSAFTGSLRPFALLLGGYLTDTLSAPPVLYVSGALCIFCGLGSLLIRGMKEL